MNHETTENAAKILMLEDDTQLAELLRDFLETHGFSVECVDNGGDGVRKILNSEFDILLCDMAMPHLPGDMFYTAVSRIKPHLCRRFIFMTGHKAEPKYEQFIQKIKGTMLWKPFLLSDLLSVVKLKLQAGPPANGGGTQERNSCNIGATRYLVQLFTPGGAK